MGVALNHGEQPEGEAHNVGGMNTREAEKKSCLTKYAVSSINIMRWPRRWEGHPSLVNSSTKQIYHTAQR